MNESVVPARMGKHVEQGMSLQECGYFACAAASCTVEHMGAADGIRSAEEPVRRWQEWRRKNR